MFILVVNAVAIIHLKIRNKLLIYFQCTCERKENRSFTFLANFIQVSDMCSLDGPVGQYNNFATDLQ